MFFYKIISEILNNANLDKNTIIELDNTLIRLVTLLEIIKGDVNVEEVNKIKKEIYSEVKNLGIDTIKVKKLFKEYVNSFDNLARNEREINEINNYMNEINSIIQSKKVDIASKVKNKLIRFLRVSNNIKGLENDRKEMTESILAGLRKDVKIETVEKGRKGRIKKAAPSDYKGYFSVTILSSIESFRDKLIKFVLNNLHSNFYEIINDMNVLKEVLLKNYKININELILKTYKLNYEKPSMGKVINRKIMEGRKLLESFGPEKITQLETVINIIKGNKNNVINHNHVDNQGLIINRRMEKFKIEGPLMEKIDQIIQESTINSYTKQIAIEKVALEYDLNWFSREMKDSLEVRSVILHDIYKGFYTGLKYIILPYSKNDWFKFRKLIQNSKLENMDINNKELIKLKSLLVILILGNDNIISTSFKIIIELISNSEDGMRALRTELVFNLGKKLFKFAIFKANKLQKIMSVDSFLNREVKSNQLLEIEIKQFTELLKLLSYNELTKVISGYNDIDIFEIGDTIMNILESKSSVVDRTLVTKDKNREVFISINEDYIKKLNISVINVTQLPMLVIPNSPDLEDGKYLPYINGETSHIYNTFDTVVKQKHEIKDKVENQHVLNETINYLNKTPFTINKDVLDFILLEWNNENSLYFKGFNKEQVISKFDSPELKRRKQSHNSKYWKYLNTINIATVYQDMEFYLPTFSDFRGRIYTLSQYLSYQGDDLCKSLLLFGKEKNNRALDSKGFNYLLIYFNNLYGNKNLNYKDIIQWSKDNIINICDMFINDIDKFNREVLPNLKEPFQFVSIVFAAIRCLNSFFENKDIILNNPILFDASCNGLQHLSALTREVEIAIKTNLVSLPDSPDMKNDFYNYAASLVQAELDNCDNDNLRKIKYG